MSTSSGSSLDTINNNINGINRMMQRDMKDGTLLCAAEIIPERCYFATLKYNCKLKSTNNTHYFSIDDELIYENFNSDFGPLNLAMLYRYCLKLNTKLRSTALCKKRIVHYTSSDPQKRVNAAFLVGAYSVIYLKKSPEAAYRNLVDPDTPAFIPFRDASFGTTSFYITLPDVLSGLHRALQNKFFDFSDFDCSEYEYYEKVENADLNWIVPEKFIAFCGPHSRTKVLNGYPLHAPEAYFSYYRKNNVKCIVRLNRHIYDASRFVNAGFQHKDLFFTDGSTPSDQIMNQFLDLAEKTDGAIAIHCKAGLGRTGSLIGCYIMKHYHFTAREAIAWTRLCRPGSVIGMQQEWLEEKQESLWELGMDKSVPRSRFPVYSFRRKAGEPVKLCLSPGDNVRSILAQVDSMRLEDGDEEEEELLDIPEDNYYQEEVDEENNLTQGDMLNRIKAFRQHQVPSKGLSKKAASTDSGKAKEGVRLKRTAGPYSSASNSTKRPYRGSNNGSGSARLLTVSKVTIPSVVESTTNLSLGLDPPEQPKQTPSDSCSRSSGSPILEVPPNRPVTRSFSRLTTPKEPHNPCPRTLRVKVRNPLSSERVLLPPASKILQNKLPGASQPRSEVPTTTKVTSQKTVANANTNTLVIPSTNLNTRVSTRSSARIQNAAAATNQKLNTPTTTVALRNGNGRRGLPSQDTTPSTSLQTKQKKGTKTA